MLSRYHMSLLDMMCVQLSHCIFNYCYPIKQFTQTIHIRGPTIEMDEGPQGPWTKGVKSGTITAIRDH